MGRFLVLVAIVVALAWLLRRALARTERGRAAPPPDAAAADTPELVQCAHCGVHLPRAEARAAGGALYCSDEHARLGPGSPS